MQQLYVCQTCEHTWEESYFLKVEKCPKCASTQILGARYGISCACQGKVPEKKEQEEG